MDSSGDERSIKNEKKGWDRVHYQWEGRDEESREGPMGGQCWGVMVELIGCGSVNGK